MLTLKNPFKIHQKKRRLFHLETKLAKTQADIESGKISICFGSKQLFKSQFNLEANGYKSHEDWQKEWRCSRNNSFFLLGSKDESQGNQSCAAFIDERENLTLRIRLPDALARQGKYLWIHNVRFAYGHEEILRALRSCQERQKFRGVKDPQAVHYGTAISYRLKRDNKGWRIFVSISVPAALKTTTTAKGVIGVDINKDHLAIAETDRFGNPIAKRTIPLNTYGKDRHQAKALIGDACTSLILRAKAKGKTVVIENLDFSKKKAALKEEGGPKHNRMLSSFAYNSIKTHLKAKGHREGVEVKEVNPAFTSLIGRIKFAKRYGLSIHHAAALVIGRRYVKATERIPRHLKTIPDGRGGYVALSQPVRNRDKHVWSSWRMLHRELQTVLVARFRAKRSSSSKPTCETDNIPKVTSETLVRESVDTTARSAYLKRSTTAIA